MATSENKLQDIIQTSLQSIKTLIDANTIIGTPIIANGTTIIPVSKIAMGYATGGLDYNGKDEAPTKAQNFGAGGGTGLSIQPLGFLVIDAEGKVDLINVGVKNPSDPIEQIADFIERSPEIIAKVKAILGKDKASEE
ncbi:MAG: sporulation protein YtfJ [Ruminococcaceae bacterium]|nr:sporulation protein YtfJ [Oscillospiraceae bacterium]